MVALIPLIMPTESININILKKKNKNDIFFTPLRVLVFLTLSHIFLMIFSFHDLSRYFY